MAQLEIEDRHKGRFVVELGEGPLPVGLDDDGRAAWGPGRVPRGLVEVHRRPDGFVLSRDGEERKLRNGDTVELDGLTLTFRGPEPEAVDLHAAALGEIGRLLWTLQREEDLFESVLDSLVRVLRVERAAIALFDDDAELGRVAERGEGLTIAGSLARAVVDSGAAILTSEAAVRDGSEGDELSFDVRSILCAPLRHEGDAQGILFTDNEGREQSFSNAELDFAAAVAHLASFALANLSRTERLREENTLLKQRLGEPVVLASPAMVDLYRKVEKVAGFDATVLITGESGVGKEMVAREIHRRSNRTNGPFVAINCAAIPDTLLESELFGHAPRSGISGAAPEGRPGRFEQADGGTIFLDEIGELKPELQAKLLRVLQDKKVDRLGDTESRDVDVRILVATNQDLERLVREGRFREDLFYRLNVVNLEVPPLRERREDVLPLAEFFIRSYPGPEELRRVKISPAGRRSLESYSWPGNVRELKNCVEQALILGDGRTIRRRDLPEALRSTARTGPAENLPPLKEVERDHIARVLEATGWNKARSARILGISKPTLYEKIRLFGLEPA